MKTTQHTANNVSVARAANAQPSAPLDLALESATELAKMVQAMPYGLTKRTLKAHELSRNILGAAPQLLSELQQLRQQRDALAGALRESLGALMPYGGNAAPKPGLIGRIRAALASLERQ